MPAVDVPSMIDCRHTNLLPLVVDRVHHAIVTDPDLPSDRATTTLLRASATWVIRQMSNSSPDSILNSLWQLAELPTVSVRQHD